MKIGQKTVRMVQLCVKVQEQVGGNWRALVEEAKGASIGHAGLVTQNISLVAQDGRQSRQSLIQHDQLVPLRMPPQPLFDASRIAN